MDAVQGYTGCNHVSGGENFHFAICNPVVRLVDGGKTWFLEWHHYFGPIACNRHGDPLPKCPGPRSRFGCSQPGKIKGVVLLAGSVSGKCRSVLRQAKG